MSTNGGKGGRPIGSGIKLTAEVQKEICDALRISVPLKYAAEAAGIGESTVHDWISRGELAGERGSEVPETELVYVAFWRAITRARAKAVGNLTTVALGGSKGSSAATWLLERRFREEYGPIQKIDHTIHRDDVENLSDDELIAAHEESLRKLRALREADPSAAVSDELDGLGDRSLSAEEASTGSAPPADPPASEEGR